VSPLGDSLRHTLKERLVDSDSLNRTLEGRGANGPCPICAKNDWHSANVFPGEVTAAGDGLSTVMFVCTNCGFVRQHAISILQR
jgi:hypothetical protein